MTLTFDFLLSLT